MTAPRRCWTVGQVGHPRALSFQKTPQVSKKVCVTCTYVFGPENEPYPVQPSNPSNLSNIRPQITPTERPNMTTTNRNGLLAEDPFDDGLYDAVALVFARGDGCTCQPTPFVDDQERRRLLHADGCPLAIWDPGALEALLTELEADRDGLALRPAEHTNASAPIEPSDGFRPIETA